MRNRRLTLMAPLFMPAGVPANLEELDRLWSEDFVLAIVESETTPGIAQQFLVMGRLLERCELTTKAMDAEVPFFTTSDVATARTCMQLIVRLDAVRAHIRHLRSSGAGAVLRAAKQQEARRGQRGIWTALRICIGSIMQDLRLHVLDCIERSEILERPESAAPRISLKGNQ